MEDPHIQAREMVFSLPHTSGANAPQIANPIKFSRSSIDYRRAPPALGEHTEAVLTGQLGKTKEQIAILRKHGTI